MQTHLRDEYVMFTFTLKSVQLSHLSPGTRTPYRATYRHPCLFHFNKISRLYFLTWFQFSFHNRASHIVLLKSFLCVSTVLI